MREFNILTDFIFIADIIKNMNTGFVNDADFTVMDRRKVLRNYCFGWLLPDMVSSVPLDLILPPEDSSSSVKGIKIFKLLRLARMAKILRVLRVSKLAVIMQDSQRSLEEYYKIKFPEGAVAMTRLFVGAMVLVHWTGCLNFMVCRIYDFHEESWVYNAGLQDKYFSLCLLNSALLWTFEKTSRPETLGRKCQVGGNAVFLVLLQGSRADDWSRLRDPPHRQYLLHVHRHVVYVTSTCPSLPLFALLRCLLIHSRYLQSLTLRTWWS